MPISQIQNEHEKSKETIKKIKRCSTQRRKNKFLLFTKKDNRAKTTDKNINVGISKQNSDNHIIKNTNSQENSATSKRMVAETYENKILLQALKDNLNVEDVIINLKSQEKAEQNKKKCNTEKYICQCEEENCISNSMKSSSKILDSSRIDEPERINYQGRITKHENTKSDILQQKLSKLYNENSYESLPNLINYFSIQPYLEKINNIPSIPVLYEITSNVSPHMTGNERKYVGIPFTSFEGRSSYLIGNNQYQPIIHKKPCICLPITNQVESSMSVTLPSTNYVDATTVRETNLESNNLINIIEEDREHYLKLTTKVPNVDTSTDSETNLVLNYSTDVTEKSNTISSSNFNKIMHKSKNFTGQIERNADNLSKLTTYSIDYDGISSTPSVIYDKINDGKFINMEECIQLFDRDVCVLSATSPRMLAKQTQKNNSNKYSTIKIPEYITQMSTRKETTLNNVNYSNKLKATDPYFASESSTVRISESNVNLNEYLELTSTTSNADKASLREFHQYPESIKQISEQDINYNKNKSFIVKNTHIPIKKLTTIDEIAKMQRNKLLGKSKSHTTKLLLNPNEEIANSISSEKFLYSTPSYKSTSDEEANNLKINQQNQVTNINSNSNISPKEETTIISYNFKTDSKANSKEQNYLKESNTDIYSEKKILQEPFKEETTTSFNFKIGNNFAEETKKEIIGIETNIQSGEISQEQSTTMQYSNDKKSNNLNNTKNSTNLKIIIDSSTSKLPFCDNTLLLNSIRKVINDFALDARLTKTKDFDESILQKQGKNLLPEILQVPNLQNILSMPQIESMIVEKVKDVLSYVTAIPRRDFTNDWSHGVIKNTLHSILDALSDFHRKLPSMALEEHQFKDGQWKTNLVTLAPISDQKSIATSENLRKSIKDLLSSPAIASQTDRNIVQNIIVQSVRNNLTNEDKDDKIDDSISYALNDILQTLKNSKDIDTLEKSNEVISNEEDMDVTYMQEMPSNYEIGINNNNSTLNSEQNLDVKEDIKVDNKGMQSTNQKVKTLENNANILTTFEFPHLLQLYEEKEEEETTNKPKIKENIRNQISSKTKKINIESDAEKKIAESLKPKINYHKAILQKNPSVLITFEPNSTEAEQYIKNHHIDKESVIETTTVTNFMQETSPNYVQVSDDKILKNMIGAKDIEKEVKHKLNKNTLITTTDKIDPLIILERIKFNLPPTKYYSPEILKYATNRIEDKNVEITTASAKLIEETSANYAQNSMFLQNIVDTKDGNKISTKESIMEYPLSTTSGNLISSTNVEYKDYKPKIISLIDKDILESQQQNFIKDNIIKIHEVTTEVQRTCAKTTYFKAGSSSDDNPRINSSSLTYETTDTHINNNNKTINSKDNNDLIDNKMNTMKAKEIIDSSSESSAVNDIYPQLFSSSTASDDISELQKSQLYYISDGMTLPLEIKRLEDGSYALSISKNICEQILTRKCPCCVPLQGHIIRSLKTYQQKDMHAITSTTMEKKNQENIYVNKRDYQSVQPFSTMITRRNALRTQNSKEEEKEEKEKINTYQLWKQNNDNLATISMPVIDFAKKYNLLLDFDEEGILLNGARLQNKIQNNNKTVIKSVERFEHQSEERNFNNYHNIKKNRLLNENDVIDKFQNLNVREKKNTSNFQIFPTTQKFFNSGKTSREFEIRKANAEMNQSVINEELKLYEIKTANNIENMNIVQQQKINSENQEKTNLALKGINISEKSKIGKKEIKWDKLSDIAEGNYHRIYDKKIKKYVKK